MSALPLASAYPTPSPLRILKGEKMTPHARVPNDIARTKQLTMQEKAVYLYLSTFNPCHPSVARIADELVTSRSTINRILRSLRSKGFLRVTHIAGDNSEYTLLTPVTHDIGGYVTGDTPVTDDTTTPVTHDIGGMSLVTPEKEQVKNTSEKEERERRAREVEPLPEINPWNPQHKPPELEDVLGHAGRIGLSDEEATEFYHHYTAGDWKDGNGKPIGHWGSKLEVWKREQQRRKKKNEPHQRTSTGGRRTTVPVTGEELHRQMERDAELARAVIEGGG